MQYVVRSVAHPNICLNESPSLRLSNWQPSDVDCGGCNPVEEIMLCDLLFICSSALKAREPRVVLIAFVTDARKVAGRRSLRKVRNG